MKNKQNQHLKRIDEGPYDKNAGKWKKKLGRRDETARSEDREVKRSEAEEKKKNIAEIKWLQLDDNYAVDSTPSIVKKKLFFLVGKKHPRERQYLALVDVDVVSSAHRQGCVTLTYTKSICVLLILYLQ